MKILLSIILICFGNSVFVGTKEYDRSLVQISTLNVKGERYGIVKLLRKNEKVRTKYFAGNDHSGESVEKRFSEWSANKTIIAYTSGTYMTTCNQYARPVGLCISDGTVIAENLRRDALDGLVIVQSTGGIVATNLKEGNLAVTYPNKTRRVFDLRNSSTDLEDFKDWAGETRATVFQTHLFVYKNKILIGGNAKPEPQQRRFLAVCKTPDKQVVHYIVNLPGASSIKEGTEKAFEYLKDLQQVSEVVFMINLDTGCQNIFKLYDHRGQEFSSNYFQGNHSIELKNAANLLVYYYE